MMYCMYCACVHLKCIYYVAITAKPYVKDSVV